MIGWLLNYRAVIFTSALHGGLELALLGVSITEFWV